MRDRIIYGGRIVCENGYITRIDEKSGVSNDKMPYISPGLIDIHNHGAMGYDYMDATEQAFSAISDHLLKHGVTSAQCTTISAPIGDILSFFKQFRNWKIKNGKPGCRFVGVHLEGPFIAKESRGAHPEETLRIPADGYDWIIENADIVKEITLAPELHGMPKMINDLKNAGIVISGGHDQAETEDLEIAAEQGMSHCTHIYCAMSTLHKKDAHRRCGLCEYAMTHDNITAEMIADGHHTPPMLASMIYKCKGADKLCIVSDAISPAGLPETGELYKLGTGDRAVKVSVENGVALVQDKSCYAGSVQALDNMIANLVKHSNIPFVDAVRMATLTPAKIIGIDKECGSLQVGKHADLCFMDNDFSVIKTVVSGKMCYQKNI